MANRIDQVLKLFKITQEEVAKRLEVTPATISRWCSNTSQPSLDKLYMLSNYLKIDILELVYGNTKHFTLHNTLDLSVLNTNDAYLEMVLGTSDLVNLQKAVFMIHTKFPDGSSKSYPLMLFSYISLYRPVHIPLIEVGKVIENCKYTKLSVENCSENLRLTFLCPVSPITKTH